MATTTKLNADIKESQAKASLSDAYENLIAAKESFTSATRSATDAAKVLGKDKYDQGMKIAKEKYSEGADQLKTAEVFVEDLVKEKPIVAIAAAFGAGWLISKLLK